MAKAKKKSVSRRKSSAKVPQSHNVLAVVSMGLFIVAIALVVWFVQQPQDTRQRAEGTRDITVKVAERYKEVGCPAEITYTTNVPETGILPHTQYNVLVNTNGSGSSQYFTLRDLDKVYFGRDKGDGLFEFTIDSGPSGSIHYIVFTIKDSKAYNLPERIEKSYEYVLCGDYSLVPASFEFITGASPNCPAVIFSNGTKEIAGVQSNVGGYLRFYLGLDDKLELPITVKTTGGSNWSYVALYRNSELVPLSQGNQIDQNTFEWTIVSPNLGQDLLEIRTNAWEAYAVTDTNGLPPTQYCGSVQVSRYINNRKNSSTKGYLDNVSCTGGYGWTCDADDYNAGLTVKIFDGKQGVYGSKEILSLTANQQREEGVGGQCGGNRNHGYSFSLPDSLKDGKAHKIYAYSMNIPQSVEGNSELIGSPKTITCNN